MSAARQRLVLLGPPGSGKGTQAELLEGELGVPAISTGEMVRAAMADGSELGRRVESIVNSGSLVDDETMGELVQRRLAEDDAREGFVLDGYPRTLPQVDTLSTILAESGRELDRVVMIEVPEEELVRRMVARGRDDDDHEVIRHRLAVYRESTAPVAERYRDEGLLAVVDGFHSIDEVHRSILEAIGAAPTEAREARV